MATIGLGMNTKRVEVQPRCREIEELTDVIVGDWHRFRRIALHVLRNMPDAEDAVQDALLSALKHVDQFRGQAQMSTWLAAIVINSARMQLRRRVRQVKLMLTETGEEQNPLVEAAADPRPSPEDTYQRQEIAESLARATRQLSPVLLRTFQLRYVAGLSISETAHLLGVPSGTVKARLARARASLKKRMMKKRVSGRVHELCANRMKNPRDAEGKLFAQ